MPDDVEIWREIPGWEHYEASSLGRIRRADNRRIVSQWPKTPWRHWDTPYLCVSLTIPKEFREPGRKKVNRSFHVHRLVCMAFHGLPDFDAPPMDAHHKDENWQNNRADNLEWIESIEHRTQHNRGAAA